MLFLFLQSVVPTVPASFLTFGDHPLYSFYDHVPAAVRASRRSTTCRSPGVDHEDRRGPHPVVMIAIIFFRWYSAEEVRTPVAAGVARPRPRADGIAPAMTDTTDRRPKPSDRPRRPTPVAGRRRGRAAPRTPVPFWQRPNVERYLVPFVHPDRRHRRRSSSSSSTSRGSSCRRTATSRSSSGRSSLVVILIGATLLSNASRHALVVDRADDAPASCSSSFASGWLVLGTRRRRTRPTHAAGRRSRSTGRSRSSPRPPAALDVRAVEPHGEDGPRTTIDARRRRRGAAHVQLRTTRRRCSRASSREQRRARR